MCFFRLNYDIRETEIKKTSNSNNLQCNKNTKIVLKLFNLDPREPAIPKKNNTLSVVESCHMKNKVNKIVMAHRFIVFYVY